MCIIYVLHTALECADSPIFYLCGQSSVQLSSEHYSAESGVPPATNWFWSIIIMVLEIMWHWWRDNANHVDLSWKIWQYIHCAHTERVYFTDFPSFPPFWRARNLMNQKNRELDFVWPSDLTSKFFNEKNVIWSRERAQQNWTVTKIQNCGTLTRWGWWPVQYNGDMSFSLSFAVCR